jgi:hypothetical protein
LATAVNANAPANTINHSVQIVAEFWNLKTAINTGQLLVWGVSISQTTVGWLLLGAAALTFVVGFASRTFVGRRRSTKAVRGLVRTFRKTGVARVLFGRFEGEVLDDDELDSMILMPTIVIGCGLCLTAIFLLGYEVLA